VTDLAVLRVATDRELPGRHARASRARWSSGDPVIAIGSPARACRHGHHRASSARSTAPSTCPGRGRRAQPAVQRHPDRRGDQPGQLRRRAGQRAGEVIGINSAIATLGGGLGGGAAAASASGFAIPIDEARSVAEEIIRTGRATHPGDRHLGADRPRERQNDRSGALVRQLTPAAAAGEPGCAPATSSSRSTASRSPASTS
jgi:putative serine protease PepD